MFKLMTKHIKGYRFYTFITPAIVFVDVLMEALIPTIMAYIVDVAGKIAIGQYQMGSDSSIEIMDKLIQRFPVFETGTTLLWTLGGTCLVMALLTMFLGALAGRTSSKASAGFAANLRLELFSRIQLFSFYNIDKFSTAGLVTRCTTDINNTQMSFQQTIRFVVRAPLMIAMATMMALNLNAEVAWIFLVTIPILGIFLAVMAYFTYPRFKRMLKLYDNMNNDVQENLVGIRVVKAFVREDYENEKYRKTAEKVRFAQHAAEKMMVVANPFAMLIMFSATLAIVYLGGSNIIGGTMQSGALTALITYSTQALHLVMMVCFVIIQLIISRASVVRINEVLNEKPDITSGSSDKSVNSGSVEFKNVNFSYSKNADNLTLTDINLSIEAGQTVGIVGGTGDGKSSLVQLIPRFYDIMDGQVLVDGCDVREYDIEKLRDGVAMVLQKNMLFSGTIAQNLRWGNEHATDEQLVEACKAACAHDFVCSFPNGYNTDLSQGGVNLSGGQKQRLCIARALLKQPKIMILDDSTSAVDTATETSIRKELNKRFADMTVIIIAQRISSISECDQIVVLNEGKVSAVGCHNQLMQSSTIYKEVFESQQKGVAE